MRNVFTILLLPIFYFVCNSCFGREKISIMNQGNYKDTIYEEPKKNQEVDSLKNIPFIFSDNPAYAGFGGRGAINLESGSQWKNMPGYPQSFLLAYDLAIKKINSGFGVYYSVSASGSSSYSTSNLNFSYSYLIKIKKSNLRIGASAAYADKSINFTNLLWDSQYINNTLTAGFTSGEPHFIGSNVKYLDINTGLFYTRGNFYSGVSVLHVNQPATSFFSDGYRLPVELNYTVGERYHYSNWEFIASLSAKQGNYFLIIEPSIVTIYNNLFIYGLSYDYLLSDTKSLKVHVGIVLFKHLRLLVEPTLVLNTLYGPALGLSTVGSIHYQF